MISEEQKVEKIDVVGSDIPKEDDLRKPVEIWDDRAWGDKGVKVEEYLALLRIGMLIWRKRRITQGFSKFMRRISREWRGRIKAVGFHVIDNKYNRDKGTR